MSKFCVYVVFFRAHLYIYLSDLMQFLIFKANIDKIAHKFRSFFLLCASSVQVSVKSERKTTIDQGSLK